MTLSNLIIQKIKQQGPISFRDFMEMALYYPGLGYYTSDKNKIGKTGDFYTSPNLTPAFGEMLGKQIEEMWRILGEKDFTVVEMGAGTGLLSCDVLAYIGKNRELYQDLNYFIVEKSPSMRDEQKRNLPDKVTWIDSIRQIHGMTGCIFSNELVDAFPVHVVVMEKELMEVFVDHDRGFFETLRPARDELKDYLSSLDISLPSGFRTEVNIDAIKWIEEVSFSLEKGFVITIDYGYPSEELYREYRNRGTLMCYYKHTANEDPYSDIGEQDITSHVNFSALDQWGVKSGLETCGLTDQAHFLMGLGMETYLKKLHDKDPANYYKKMLPIKTLLMDMGETFKILIQKKGIGGCELSGMAFPGRYRIK